MRRSYPYHTLTMPCPCHALAYVQMSAALAYDKKSREMHGTKAFVNFPDDPS
jgi:hypothetical protein